jgi:hypothetical protein
VARHSRLFLNETLKVVLVLLKSEGGNRESAIGNWELEIIFYFLIIGVQVFSAFDSRLPIPTFIDNLVDEIKKPLPVATV